MVRSFKHSVNKFSQYDSSSFFAYSIDCIISTAILSGCRAIKQNWPTILVGISFNKMNIIKILCPNRFRDCPWGNFINGSSEHKWWKNHIGIRPKSVAKFGDAFCTYSLHSFRTRFTSFLRDFPNMTSSKILHIRKINEK